MLCWPAALAWRPHPTSSLCPWPRSCHRSSSVPGVTREPRNQSVLLHLRQLRLVRRSLTTNTAHALVQALITVAWTTAMACLQVCQQICSTASSLYFGPLHDLSSAYQAVHQSCQQSVICFIGLVILSVSRLNSAWQPTNACTAWHQLTSPSSAHCCSPSLVVHTAFCQSTHSVRPPHVYLVIRYTGVLLIGPVVLEHSSLAASWPSHLHQHLHRETCLFNNCSDWLCFILHHVLCFLRFCHRTRFRDSFCSASVF